MNFRRIIFEGGLVEQREILNTCLKNEIQANWVYDSMVDCEIVFSDLAERAVSYGAAGYFIERAFTPPSMQDVNGARFPKGIDLLRMAKIQQQYAV
jgi:hypothetical protein